MFFCFIRTLFQCLFVKYFVVVAIETVKMLISFGVSSISLLPILSSYTPMYLDIFLDNLTNISKRQMKYNCC